MDMGDIQITANEEARTTTITLPVTRVQVILFLRRILELWRQKTGFLNKITFDDYNSFINEQKIVIKKAVEFGLFKKQMKRHRKPLTFFDSYT